MRKNHRSQLARLHFFSKQVHMKKWKDSMSGKNELSVIDVLNMWGYKINEDYFRQYPIGDRYVLDFAFPNEQVAIEVNGKSHYSKIGRKKDKEKEKFLIWNNWVLIEVPEKKFFKNPSFYKHLIHEIIEERRKKIIKNYNFTISPE
ncbi:MAG: DUF559 domain-containing protein [Endomicrobia bacterium]|nr:DUF559 domain-containing protein [Endomicrobiia bacterium]